MHGQMCTGATSTRRRYDLPDYTVAWRPTMLPTLIIPGAQKSATTSLASILSSHPDVYMGEAKEPHFFSRDSRYLAGQEEYRSVYAGYNGERVVFDASTSYLPLRAVPERIDAVLGRGIKFIIALRNPVDRAVSGFLQMNINEHGDLRSSVGDLIPNSLADMSLSELLAFEQQRTVEGIHEGVIRPKNPAWGWGIFPYDYFAIGCYSAQLERYLDMFPRENFLFLSFEEIVGSQAATKRKIADFLGIDPRAYSAPEGTRSNASRVPLRSYRVAAGIYRRTLRKIVPRVVSKNARKMARRILSRRPSAGFSPAVYDRLLDIFGAEITRTSELTGLDLGAWRARR